MLVRCDCCGGENGTGPGQEMLTCAYCGAALAIEKRRGPERLILAHTRNDASAEAALRSFLVEKGCGRPPDMSTTFSFMPFSMIEDSEGTITVAPASAPSSRLGGLPYPPAGHYHFFSEASPPAETIAPEEPIDRGAVRVVHLPVYLIRCGTGNGKGEAAVIGESWQVIARELPPEKPRALDGRAVVAAAGLFAGYLLAALLIPRVFPRLVFIAAAALASHAALAIRERAAKRG